MRVALLTGGGDCPGLNAAIRAFTKCAILEHNIEVLGIYDSFKGLLSNPRKTKVLSLTDVKGILSTGGTILGTDNRGLPLGENKAQSIENIKIAMNEEQLDGLVVIGGEGTQGVAAELDKHDVPIIGIPKTIDNDLPGTEQTIGFASCVDFVADAVKRLRSTAESHDRVMVIEVMGRDSGYIALHGGLAGGAHAILIPEIAFDLKKVEKKILERKIGGERFSIIVVSEGAKEKGEKAKYIDESVPNKRLGGIGQYVANKLAANTGIESRVTVLGHLQRGGEASPVDRILASNFAVHACNLASQKNFGRFVIHKAGKVSDIPYKIISPYERRIISEKNDILKSARILRICLGQ